MRLNVCCLLMLPSIVFADGAYVSTITTIPANMAGYTIPEQVIGPIPVLPDERIINQSKVWVLGDADAVNEVSELAKPISKTHKKAALSKKVKAVDLTLKTQSDCAMCEAERKVLLGKIAKKTIQNPVEQAAN